MLFLSVSGLRCPFEPVAAADRRHFQMKRSVLGVPAIIENGIRSLMRRANLHEGCVMGAFMVFTEMKAETALSVM
jgi:hypothetical protein